MNTIRVAREPGGIGEAPAAAHVRTLALATALCIAAFACCYAIGRAERPGAPAEQLLPSLPAASAGAAIPLTLGDAGPVGLSHVVASPAPTHATNHPAPAVTPRSNAPRLSAPAPTTRVSPVTPAVAPAVSAPVVHPPAASQPTATPPPTPTASKPPSGGGQSPTGGTSSPGHGAPAPSGRPTTKSETSSGTSFDSSG